MYKHRTTSLFSYLLDSEIQSPQGRLSISYLEKNNWGDGNVPCPGGSFNSSELKCFEDGGLDTGKAPSKCQRKGKFFFGRWKGVSVQYVFRKYLKPFQII